MSKFCPTGPKFDNCLNLNDSLHQILMVLMHTPTVSWSSSTSCSNKRGKREDQYNHKTIQRVGWWCRSRAEFKSIDLNYFLFDRYDISNTRDKLWSILSRCSVFSTWACLSLEIQIKDTMIENSGMKARLGIPNFDFGYVPFSSVSYMLWRNRRWEVFFSCRWHLGTPVPIFPSYTTLASKKYCLTSDYT